MAKKAKAQKRKLTLTPDEEYRRKLIRRVGEAAFGEHGNWKERLSEAIGISRPSIHFYDVASRPAPEYIEGRLLQFLRKNRHSLVDTMRKEADKLRQEADKRDAELAALEREVEEYAGRRD